MQSSPKM